MAKKKQPKGAPKGLPPVKTGAETSAIAGLVEDRPRVVPGGRNFPAINKARMCKTCGKEGRVITNSNGVFVKCHPCNSYWPVAPAIVGIGDAEVRPRGLSKETQVEPDWDKAFD
jgi:hypothetical protein